MKIQVDEEGQKAIESLIDSGMRKGAWGAADLNPLMIIRQSIKLRDETPKQNEKEHTEQNGE